MNISVLPITEDKIDDLMVLMRGYFDFYKVQGPETEKLRNWIITLMEPSEMSTQFIAEYNGESVGFVTLYETFSTMSASKMILMNDLYVDPSARGKGIGKELFQTALEYTKNNNYPKMEWMTAPDNKRARQFYDELGGKSSTWVFYSMKP